jgi:hypothetical protein
LIFFRMIVGEKADRKKRNYPQVTSR